jgi:hypothetical protein
VGWSSVSPGPAHRPSPPLVLATLVFFAADFIRKYLPSKVLKSNTKIQAQKLADFIREGGVVA